MYPGPPSLGFLVRACSPLARRQTHLPWWFQRKIHLPWWFQRKIHLSGWFLAAWLLVGGCADDPGEAAPTSAGGQGGAAAGASGAQGGTPTAAGAGGTATRSLDVTPLYYGGKGEPLQPIEEGAQLLVKLPPQGGYVLWIGAAVRGSEDSTVEVHGRLRSKATGAIVAEEERTFTLGPEDEDGWAWPSPISIRNLSNIPVCPNYGDEELLGAPLLLEVRIEDHSSDPPGLGVVKLGVTLGCVEGATNCPCECSLGYFLGQCGPSLEDPIEF